jgi:hypothetical protein
MNPNQCQEKNKKASDVKWNCALTARRKSGTVTYVGTGEGFGCLPGAGWLVEEWNLVLATQLQQQP